MEIPAQFIFVPLILFLWLSHQTRGCREAGWSRNSRGHRDVGSSLPSTLGDPHGWWSAGNWTSPNISYLVWEMINQYSFSSFTETSWWLHQSNWSREHHLIKYLWPIRPFNLLCLNYLFPIRSLCFRYYHFHLSRKSAELKQIKKWLHGHTPSRWSH